MLVADSTNRADGEASAADSPVPPSVEDHAPTPPPARESLPDNVLECVAVVLRSVHTAFFLEQVASAACSHATLCLQEQGLQPSVSKVLGRLRAGVLRGCHVARARLTVGKHTSLSSLGVQRRVPPECRPLAAASLVARHFIWRAVLRSHSRPALR